MGHVLTGRERLRTIFAGEPADRCGFWLGNPHPDSWPRLHAWFGTSSEEELRRRLHDDFRWINPGSAYRHPEGKPMFDVQRGGEALDGGGAFADCESVEEVESFAWPDPDHLDFSETLEQLDRAGEAYRASGFWCPFYHQLADFFGMDTYFLRMYTHPEVVHAATRRMVDFYLEANRRLYARAGDRIDGFFFGNDFGTQQGLQISPELLSTFVFPYLAELSAQARDHGYQVVLHSCGAIHDVIPDLIGFGVDALHPLQAGAAKMDADTLAADFKGRIAFMGGIDTQRLLVHARPDAVRAEVRRVRDRLGPAYVVSPSHEAILPDVPPENVEAMAAAAVEGVGF